MDKKIYVIKILELIKDSFPLADGLILLIKNHGISDKLLDSLISSFEKTLGEIEDEEKKSKIIKSRDFLKELKKQEIKDKEKDHEDIQKLEDMIKNI
ncbi:MAG TPA: hypothetical protein VJ892_00820 [Candidatus Absconditabacterales bacterium]|nr:hypothetical protein [Candidatus Absconditabacterales bacterium]